MLIGRPPHREAARRPVELVCPAGSLPSLQAAVDNGCDSVYVGLHGDTSARHFPGLNFDPQTLAEGIRYAHARGARVFVAVNTYPRPAALRRWEQAVDYAGVLGADAVIVADIGLLHYAATRWPQLPRHLSVQASATSVEAVRFYRKHLGVRRVVLPRVLALSQVREVASGSPVPVEVFAFGMLCVMAEGRCILSSYVTGTSPNTDGVCCPPNAVRWHDTPGGMEVRLNDVPIDRVREGEPAGYPTVCKGRYRVGGPPWHAIEAPTSLNVLALLPELQAMGVAAVKIEGRQRSRSYVARVTRVWRAAIDACHRDPRGYRPAPAWVAELDALAEGAQTTFGAYHRPWQ